MQEATHKPRVGLLGASPAELEILGELQRTDRVVWVGVYDPDPNAVGLGIAEVLGIPAGADTQARDRLRQAEYVVLPQDRLALRGAVEWASGLRAELVGADEARRRWGGAGVTRATEPRPAPSTEIERALETTRLLEERKELADWLLGIVLRDVGATGGSIQLLSSDTSELYLVAARGLSEGVVRTSRHPFGEPISGFVAATRTLQVLQGRQPVSRSHERGEIGSAVCVPLEDAAACVGVLSVSTGARGRQLGDEQVMVLRRLAPHVAALLHRAEGFEKVGVRGLESGLPRMLARLDREHPDLRTRCVALCGELCAEIEAEAASLYVPSEEGDWLSLGAAERSAEARERGAPSRSSVGRAFAEQRWLHVAESAAGVLAPDPEDAVASAVDRAFAAPGSPPSCSRVYVPLAGTHPVGILVAQFAGLEPAERFVRHGASLALQIALYLEAALRERRQERRAAGLGQLARLLPQLLALRGTATFDEALVRYAAELVGARRAALRRVVEARRMYSRPVLHGIAAEEQETWRRIDSQVTERLLQTRRAEITAAVVSESERLGESAAYRSIASLPVQYDGAIVAALNLYDKEPRDVLDGLAFTDFDRELLESLCLVAAPLMIDVAPLVPPGAAPGALHAPPAAAAPAAPSGEAPRDQLLEALEREVARAARYHHGFSVSRLQLTGLAALVARIPDVLEELSQGVRGLVRSTDVCGWYGTEDLVVVSPESHTRNRQLEDRLVKEIRVLLGRHVAAGDPEIEIRVGSSTYPRDAQDVPTLLALAAERLR